MQPATLSPSNLVMLPPILNLPVELHQELVSHLGGDQAFSLLGLRIKNQYFYNPIYSPSHGTLLRLEKRFNGTLGYACKHCLRLRPVSKFATKIAKLGVRQPKGPGDAGLNTPFEVFFSTAEELRRFEQVQRHGAGRI